MKIGVFLKLVEIETKVASVFPFTIATLFVYYRYDRLNPMNILLMFASLLCIDMATTTINNFMDYKRAIKKEGFNYEFHNGIVKYGLSEVEVVALILGLISIGTLLGIVLVYRTDLLVLLVGGVSFAVGILYSYGPLPISRTPLGELFSGIFMGFVIFFLGVYIHVFDLDLVYVVFSKGMLMIKLDVKELAVIGIVSIPLVLGISNIMLANNICDIEDDLVNKRFTLPIYIGKKRAIFVFEVSYALAIFIMLMLSALKIMPSIFFGSLLVGIPILKFTKKFRKVQTKKETFIISVKSFILISLTFVGSLIIGILF